MSALPPKADTTRRDLDVANSGHRHLPPIKAASTGLSRVARPRVLARTHFCHPHCRRRARATWLACQRQTFEATLRQVLPQRHQLSAVSVERALTF
jgi:hypothetical protein